MTEQDLSQGASPEQASQDEAVLDYTGERFMPHIKGNIFLEHMHRYVVAASFVSGGRVLDIASGEGYGSDYLAQTAAEVIGIDIDPAAVAHARRKYSRPGLRYEQGSITAIPLPDASVDVVVSFETIEHIDAGAQAQMMAEIRRVLSPGGVFIVSTPEKAIYSDASGAVNPFHVRELYRDEFVELLEGHFAHVQMHHQKINFGSLIVAEAASAPFVEVRSETLESVPGQFSPTYLIAVASDDPARAEPRGGLFSQEMQASEPVLRRVEFERAAYDAAAAAAKSAAPPSAAFEELEWVVGQVGILQRTNVMSQARLSKLIKRLIVTRLLYWLSNREGFSERRRKRLRRSAEKRDPMLLARRVDSFCHEFVYRLNSNQELGEDRKALLRAIGLKVTAIVPSYNHAPFLRQRLDCILNQGYPLIDLLILDDMSTDGSREIIEEYAARYPDRIRAVFNETNSGSVFAQWQKGHEMATGDLIWFCESDDFAETDFVERLIGSFRDPSVMLAFGRIEFANSAGEMVPGLDHYRESAEAGIWGSTRVRPAAEWFAGGFGVKNVIANVGGSLWRRAPMAPEVWAEARTYRVMGDWYLYSEVAQGGQIAFEPSAVAYFRNHGENTSGQGAQSKPAYYREYAKLMAALKRRWDIPDTTVDRFVAQAEEIFHGARVQGAAFGDLVSAQELKAIQREIPHVLMGILGFSYGGGEIFPIHLSNALRQIGIAVSVLQMSDVEDEAAVRAMIDPSIPVYSANVLRDLGGQAFIDAAQVSIVHSHLSSVEMLLLDQEKVSLPYVSTLHGSYEAMKIPRAKVASWAAQVDRFAYLADRNLTPFEPATVTTEKFIRFRNAMPLDPRPLPQTRAELSIPEEALVFSLVARGIEGKGWGEAVLAFQALRRRRPEVPMALILAGGGPATDAAKALAGDDPAIHFLGFISEVQGLYRLSDVALVPTRFPGESFPLCIIQAMQVGVPCVATDVGEIRAMVQPGAVRAGLTVPFLDEDEAFVAAVSETMEEMLDPARRAELVAGAQQLGQEFGMEALAREYLALYRDVMAG